ncbi:hypothetical protein G5I_03834 [Acromyrmex echinatior]|uniref:Uncharacterized protein n=1 Tax=Acromyrmex echinatior TaxID=103372 RepID=F4WE03_ACREC|nr:hypothetical protein G5I_03834 [Acromyrmex echinatior]
MIASPATIASQTSMTRSQLKAVSKLLSEFSGFGRTIAIDITQLHVGEIKLFHHLFEIDEIVEVDEVMKEEEEEEEDVEEKKVEGKEEENKEEEELYICL